MFSYSTKAIAFKRSPQLPKETCYALLSALAGVTAACYLSIHLDTYKREYVTAYTQQNIVPVQDALKATDSLEQKRKVELQKQEDQFYIAATVWGEARGEGLQGMKAVGDVIINRVGKYGKSVRDTVLSPRQFSCWNAEDPNSKLLTKWHLEHLAGDEAASWEMAKIVAYREVSGSKDITGGALHYHAKQIRPFWTKVIKVLKTMQVIKHHKTVKVTKIRYIKPPMRLARIGSHIFYR